MAAAPAPPSDAQLRVDSGRVVVFSLASATELCSLTRASGPRALAGGVFVQASARSDLELRWPGKASVRLAGPAAFALETAGRLELERFQNAELEVRRAGLQLALGNDIELTLASGALQVTSLPDGGVALLHRGGQPVEIGVRAQASRTLHPGERLRLRR